MKSIEFSIHFVVVRILMKAMLKLEFEVWTMINNDVEDTMIIEFQIQCIEIKEIPHRDFPIWGQWKRNTRKMKGTMRWTRERDRWEEKLTIWRKSIGVT